MEAERRGKTYPDLRGDCLRRPEENEEVVPRRDLACLPEPAQILSYVCLDRARSPFKGSKKAFYLS